MANLLSVRELVFSDALDVLYLLKAQSETYAQYFHPFPADNRYVWNLLMGAKDDVYAGLWYDRALVGIIMLRGWDEGYTVPSFGVLISEPYARLGLGRFALDWAIATAKLRGATTLRLKVHPENSAAYHLYASTGFVQTGEEPPNIVMHRDL